MGDKEISMLPATDGVTDDTLIPVYQPGATEPAQHMKGKQFAEFAMKQVQEDLDELSEKVSQLSEENAQKVNASLDTISEVTDVVTEETVETKTLFDSNTDAFVPGIVLPGGVTSPFENSNMTPALDVRELTEIKIVVNSFTPWEGDEAVERNFWTAQTDESGKVLSRVYTELTMKKPMPDANGNMNPKSGELIMINAAGGAEGIVPIVDGAVAFYVFNIQNDPDTGVMDAIDMQITCERILETKVEKRLVKAEALPQFVGRLSEEVADIRTAYDGTVHNTAGEAVREQFTSVVEKVDSVGERMATKIVSNNLFDKTTATIRENTYLGKDANGNELYGWFLTGGYGVVSTEASGSGFDGSSKAIEIEGGETYFKTYSIVNFFDKDDKWLNVQRPSFDVCSFVAPESAKYIRMSIVSSDIGGTQLVKGNKLLPHDDFKLGWDGVVNEQYSAVNEILSRNALNAPFMQEYNWKIAEEALKYAAPNRHTFAFIADTHARNMANRPMSMVANMTKYVPCAYVAHGGDIVDGVSQKANELLLLSTLARNANDAICPTYYVKGNHDWNKIYVESNSASADEYILNSELARRTNLFNKHGIIGDVENMYFYVDDEEAKIRSIFLNVYNKDTGLDSGDQVIGREQYEWLINDAYNFTSKEDRSEWGVIVFAHFVPLGQFQNISRNFKAGKAATFTVTEGDSSYDISFDFTNQGAMNFIAVFIGDCHYDGVRSIDFNGMPTPYIYLLNASGDNSYVSYSEPPASWALLSPTKIAGTENETAFDIVTIDKENHLIYLTRYGARSYTLNTETGAYDKVVARTRIVDYSTASYVACEE